MSNSLRMYEQEITDIVDQTLKEIFLQYFQMEIDLEKFREGNLVDPYMSGNKLLDKDALAVVILSIEKEMMNTLVHKVFPSTMDYDLMVHSCINEITNIVSSRLKTFLNEQGYDFNVGIPSVMESIEIANDDVVMRFVSEDNYLAVDVGYIPDKAVVA